MTKPPYDTGATSCLGVYSAGDNSNRSLKSRLLRRSAVWIFVDPVISKDGNENVACLVNTNSNHGIEPPERTYQLAIRIRVDVNDVVGYRVQEILALRVGQHPRPTSTGMPSTCRARSRRSRR